jgi:hypothetical protein
VLEWLIGVVANLLGIPPLAAVALLVVASVGTSAVLAWHRRVRQDEYFYLNLTKQLDLVQKSGVALDPFTLQSTEDPRLREASASAAREPAVRPAGEPAKPKAGARPASRGVVRRARRA